MSEYTARDAIEVLLVSRVLTETFVAIPDENDRFSTEEMMVIGEGLMKVPDLVAIGAIGDARVGCILIGQLLAKAGFLDLGDDA